MRDLVIVGAGITGAAVFRASARAGLSVCLLDRGRAGGATTAVTSGLFHGGLRYLPYDVATSYAMCLEISRLLAASPGLLKRQVFLWPVYRHHRLGMGLVESLMECYDRFADLRSSPGHFRLSASRTIDCVPAIERSGLIGSLSFDEWRVDVCGLVQGLLAQGRAAGGEVLEGRRVVAFVARDGRIMAARARGLEGRDAEFHARVFVNAAGPWAEEVAVLAGSKAVKLSLRRGVHLVIPHEPPRCGLIFPEPSGRYIGLYPREGEFWVGPTDDPQEGSPDQLAVTPSEAQRLRRSLGTILPGYPAASGRTVAGLRPIFRQFMVPGMLSRDYRIIDHSREGIGNLLSAVGGKLTSHRPMAEDILAAVLPKLEKPAPPPLAVSGGGLASRLLATHNRFASAALSAAMLAYHAMRHAVSRPSALRGDEGFRQAYPDLAEAPSLDQGPHREVPGFEPGADPGAKPGA
ncbi:MAG: FAD-dependent oxidoreductase [Elusimicrobia bacterium]|nr:FAD-dependent oxidoreductase [Elusimicrobiota bacterium]